MCPEQLERIGGAPLAARGPAPTSARFNQTWMVAGSLPVEASGVDRAPTVLLASRMIVRGKRRPGAGIHLKAASSATARMFPGLRRDFTLSRTDLRGHYLIFAVRRRWISAAGGRLPPFSSVT